MDLPDLTPNLEFAALASREQLERAMEALNKVRIETEIVPDRETARDHALALVPEGAEVQTALSETMQELGIKDVIEQSGRYDAIRPKLMAMDRATQGRQMAKLASAPDYVLGSVHAVTEDGHLVIGSGTGSQLASYVSGAGHVILIAGAQKVVPTLEIGLRRVREYSLPLEDARMKALGRGGSLLAKILVMSFDSPGRTHLILVEEAIGF